MIDELVAKPFPDMTKGERDVLYCYVLMNQLTAEQKGKLDKRFKTWFEVVYPVRKMGFYR